MAAALLRVLTFREGHPEFPTLPPGLPFTLALAHPIDTATAAAGDTITAKLTTPLTGKGNNVLVPKGATVTGRIAQIVRLYTPPSLLVGIGLETIENDGVTQPFAARLATAVQRLDVANLGDFGGGTDLGPFSQIPQLDDPAVGIIRLEVMTDGYIIHQGLKLKGTTIARQP